MKNANILLFAALCTIFCGCTTYIHVNDAGVVYTTDECGKLTSGTWRVDGVKPAIEKDPSPHIYQLFPPTNLKTPDSAKMTFGFSWNEKLKVKKADDKAKRQKIWNEMGPFPCQDKSYDTRDSKGKKLGITASISIGKLPHPNFQIADNQDDPDHLHFISFLYPTVRDQNNAVRSEEKRCFIAYVSDEPPQEAFKEWFAILDSTDISLRKKKRAERSANPNCIDDLPVDIDPLLDVLEGILSHNGKIHGSGN